VAKHIYNTALAQIKQKMQSTYESNIGFPVSTSEC